MYQFTPTCRCEIIVWPIYKITCFTHINKRWQNYCIFLAYQRSRQKPQPNRYVVPEYLEKELNSAQQSSQSNNNGATQKPSSNNLSPVSPQKSGQLLSSSGSESQQKSPSAVQLEHSALTSNQPSSLLTVNTAQNAAVGALPSRYPAVHSPLRAHHRAAAVAACDSPPTNIGGKFAYDACTQIFLSGTLASVKIKQILLCLNCDTAECTNGKNRYFFCNHGNLL